MYIYQYINFRVYFFVQIYINFVENKIKKVWKVTSKHAIYNTLKCALVQLSVLRENCEWKLPKKDYHSHYLKKHRHSRFLKYPIIRIYPLNGSSSIPTGPYYRYSTASILYPSSSKTSITSRCTFFYWLCNIYILLLNL